LVQTHRVHAAHAVVGQPALDMEHVITCDDGLSRAMPVELVGSIAFVVPEWQNILGQQDVQGGGAERRAFPLDASVTVTSSATGGIRSISRSSMQRWGSCDSPTRRSTFSGPSSPTFSRGSDATGSRCS